MSARILVVDDNPLNIKLLSARLAREYYAVETASDGYQALEAAARNTPDLILLDVQMPGLDGFQVCEQLRADPKTRHVPVVMVTALTEMSDRLQGLKSGADDFLSKPINEVALLARVRSLLRLKFMMDEWRLREQAAAQFGVDGSLAPPEELTSSIEGAKLLFHTDDTFEVDRLVAKLAIQQVELEYIDDRANIAARLAEGQHEVLLLGLRIGDEGALQTIADLRAAEATRQLPIVVVADDADIVRVARALELGATEYILRPLDGNELLARVRTQIRQTRAYQRLRSNYERSLAMALTDPLTGAFNRRYLDLHLGRLTNRAATGSRPLTALCLDLDHFKQINDSHGHPAGDAVLRELVSRLNSNLRSFDLVVRTGGEEFAVIMPETDIATAAMIGERLCHRVADAPFQLTPEQSVPVTISIGVASMAEDKSDADGQGMMARADAALYQAKRNGRNRVELAREERE